MGDEIATTGFRAEDFSLFARRLAEETEIARAHVRGRRAFRERDFRLASRSRPGSSITISFPAPINQRLLEALDNPLVVPELSRFNVELNSEPLALGGRCARPRGRGAVAALGPMQRRRSWAWRQYGDDRHAADDPRRGFDARQYFAAQSLLRLNKEVLRRRRGRPLRVDIEGRDHLVCEHRDVMLEAATTSFQIHLQVPADLAASLLQRLGRGLRPVARRLRQLALAVRQAPVGGDPHSAVRTGGGRAGRPCRPPPREHGIGLSRTLLPRNFRGESRATIHRCCQSPSTMRRRRCITCACTTARSGAGIVLSSALTPTARRIFASSTAFCRPDPPSPT